MGHTFFAFFISSSLQYSTLAVFRSPCACTLALALGIGRGMGIGLGMDLRALALLPLDVWFVSVVPGAIV